MSQEVTQRAPSRDVVAWEELAGLPRVGRQVALTREEHNIIGLVLGGKEVVDIDPDIFQCLYAVCCVSLFPQWKPVNLYTEGASSPCGTASC